MDFNAQTKISELIKFNKNSIEAIASIAKPLEKLKNPILRKVMASRVSVGEAAKMGGCQVTDFAQVLAPLGFRFERLASDNEVEQEPRPDWLVKSPAADIEVYDVRPIINSGSDPLKEILHRFKEIQPGKILNVVNNFIPTPLIHLLTQEKAEASFVQTISHNEFHTYFLKRAKESSTSIPKRSEQKINMDGEQEFENITKQFSANNTKEIDVRDLEMPGPMQTILAELNELPANNALYIHHKRVPVYLLEELADKDFEIHIRNIEDGNVKMLIFKHGT